MNNREALDLFFECYMSLWLHGLVVIVCCAIVAIPFLKLCSLSRNMPEMRRRYDIALENMNESGDSVEREVWTEEVDKYNDAIQSRLRADTEKLVAKAYKKDAKSHE